MDLDWDEPAGRTVTSTLLRDRESVCGDAIRAAEDWDDIEFVVITELADRAAAAEAADAASAASRADWAAMWASSSCSCWSALTNAAFKRLVCSAFNAFLTLVVTQFSHITLTSLPVFKEKK